MAVLSAVLAHQLAACLLFAAEAIELWRADARGFAAVARQGLVIMAAGGTALGVLVAGFEAVRRALEVRTRVFESASVFYAALALPVLYGLGRELFSGAWISRQPYAPFGPPLVALFGAIGVFIALRVVARLASISVRLAAAGLALAGFVLALLDRAVTRDLYLYLHATFMSLCALVLGGAFRLLFARSIGPSPRRISLAALAAAALSVGLVLVFTHGPNIWHRSFWDRHFSYSGRLYEGVRHSVFMLRTLGVPRGVYREDVAGWLSDQRGLGSPEENLAAWQASIDDARGVAALAASPSAGATKPHLILITVDALRADHGFEALERGSLASLRQSGVIYRRAFASSPRTRKSLPVLLSGRSNWRLQEHTIIGSLAKGGYDTAFVTDAEVARWLEENDQAWIDQPKAKLLAGRDAAGWSSEQITELAVQRIASQGADTPLFLWAHYFDVHEWKKLEQDTRGGDPASCYRRAWARVQAQIAKVVEAAQDKLGAERVAIVLSADHGEYLGEMNRLFHGNWVAPELMRVPLVLSVPGEQPREVLETVGLIDVAPTLAWLAGVSLPEAEGIPLLVDDAAGRARRPLAMNASSEIGVVRGDRRLVLEPARDILRVYDDAAGGKELRGGSAGVIQRELLTLLLGSPVAREGRSLPAAPR